MNKKEECEISRALSVQYLEKSLNEGSTRFVETHLKNCDTCREYYKTIENKIYKNNEQDKIITKQFKKIHNRIGILKMSLAVILIVIIVIGCILWFKQSTFSNIVNKVSTQVEYMKDLNNYKITVQTTQKNFKNNESWEYKEVYYYKDGKLKREADNSIFFNDDESFNSIKVYHDLKQIEYYHNNFIEQKKGDAIGALSYIKDNYEHYTSTIYSLIFSVREDRFNGVDCYVIRFGDDDSYRDVWVDKNNFITIRAVNEVHSSFFREEIYTFEENVVTENDVDSSVLNSEKYSDYKKITIENELPKEELEIYNSFQAE